MDAFSDICNKVLDKHVRIKKRYLSSNHKPFINNEISKAIMTRNRLRNCFLKNRKDENGKLFCKQRNSHVPHLRKSKKDYLAKLSEKKIQMGDNSGRRSSPFRQRRFNYQT